jgi:enoyl-CoA hydratase
MGSLVHYRLESSNVRLTMDDGKVNVLSTRMLAELHEAFERASREGVPVVLSGRERVFSAGFDLNVLRGGGPEAAEMLNSGFTLAERILSFPTPVVIVGSGHAIAMGFFLLLSGDYRIGAAGPFKLTANEVAIGLVMPRTPVALCQYRLVPGYFDRALLLAEVFSPEMAVSGGILDRVVEASELEGAVSELVETLAALDMPAHQASKLRARAAVLATFKETIAADDADYRATFLQASAT